MDNPFAVLGLKGWADPEEIRAAYRALVKQCHPDMIQDPQMKEQAQQRMVALNLAYEEALRLASPRTQALPGVEVSAAEAILMAERCMAKGRPEAALRQLLKTESRSAAWYYLQGKALMALEQFESAHQSFREAIRRDPENNLYRSDALAAVVAHRQSQTIHGKLKKAVKGIFRK